MKTSHIAIQGLNQRLREDREVKGSTNKGMFILTTKVNKKLGQFKEYLSTLHYLNEKTETQELFTTSTIVEGTTDKANIDFLSDLVRFINTEYNKYV